MFTPHYRLTTKLLANIALIERLYGRLEGLRIPKKLELNLERNNLIQSTYISNSIEGNPLSLPEVTNLLLNDRIAANKNEKEIKNYFEILKSLENLASLRITPELVCDLHKRLLTGVNDQIAGEVRNKPVAVGKQIKGKLFQIKHHPPFHKRQKIENALRQLLSWVSSHNEIPPIVRAGIFHHQFVFIHPFEDGNGRICRLLTALILLQNNYCINRYFVLDDYYDIDRLQYSDKLHSADSGDKTEWLEYFTDGVKYSLQSAFSKYKNAIVSLSASERLTPKEQEVLKFLQEKGEITSGELAKKLAVSRQQAHGLLKILLEKGYLGKKGRTKASFYYLK